MTHVKIRAGAREFDAAIAMRGYIGKAPLPRPPLVVTGVDAGRQAVVDSLPKDAVLQKIVDLLRTEARNDRPPELAYRKPDRPDKGTVARSPPKRRIAPRRPDDHRELRL